MSGAISAASIAGIASAAATAIGAGATIYSANQQSKSAKAAAQAQKEQTAALAASQPQQAKAPGQSPATDGGLATGTNALGTGNFNSNTLLTGAQGVTDALNLGKNKLSGGAATADPLGGLNTLLGA